MNTITELKTKEGVSTGLIAVKVPKDAKEITFMEGDKGKFIRNCIRVDFDDTCENYDLIDLENYEKYEQLGLVTADTILFDCGEYVGICDSNTPCKNTNILDCHDNGCFQAKNNFRELLAVNNLYWINPIERTQYMDPRGEYFEKFHNAESNLLADNNLLILKKL